MKIVPRRRDASTLEAILRSPEIEALIRTIESAHVSGRRGYGARMLIAIVLTKLLYVQPTWTATVDLIADNPVLLKACGCTSRSDLASAHAIYRFLRKLRVSPQWLESCICATQTALRGFYPDFGEVSAGDATDLTAHANGQRYVRQGGRLRTRFSDPSASWGHRGATSTRAHGGFYGYRPHAIVCTKYELPVAWILKSGKEDERAQVEPLLEIAERRGFGITTLVLDRGYDYGPVYTTCHARRIRLVCPLRQPDKKRDGYLVPICRHGRHEHRWVYAGTDIRRGASKWRGARSRSASRPASGFRSIASTPQSHERRTGRGRSTTGEPPSNARGGAARRSGVCSNIDFGASTVLASTSI